MPNTNRHSLITTVAAIAILLTLALRMTITETLRVPLADRMTALTQPINEQTPQPGPAHTVAFTIVILLSAAAVAGTHRLTKKDWLFLAGAGAASALMLASTFNAANRFAALIGTCDIIMSLAAAFAMLILGRHIRIKQIMIAAVAALAVVWIAKGFYQYYVEIPDTLYYIEEHKAEIFAQRGWQPDDPQAILYLARANSREITGYITFSNVVAAGLTPMILLLLAAAWQFLAEFKAAGAHPQENAQRHASAESQTKKPDKKDAPNDIPLLPLVAGICAILALAAVWQLVVSDSKGGIGAFVLCLPIVILGMLMPRWVAAHRTMLMILASVVGVALAAGVIGYGVTHHGLPTLSLLYRWHYWLGALPMIEHSPLLGVGLNNFGDYYTMFKLPQSPEDVKDPHSIFVRFAAEGGLPLTLIILILIVWLLVSGLRSRKLPDPPVWGKASLWGIAAVIMLWWLIRLLIAEVPTLEFNIIMAFLNAAIAAAVAALILSALGKVSGTRISRLLNVLVIGAAGMLIYDQINMGLTTGPLAMTFWCILAVAAAPCDELKQATPALSSRVTACVIAAAGVALGIFVWAPLTTQSFAWDPTPWEDRGMLAQNSQQSLAAWDEAIARNPRSVELRRQRMRIRQTLQQPIEQDIEAILALNNSDARLFMDLGLMSSNLPPARRKEILEQALKLDDLMPADQPRKMRLAEREKLTAAIRELAGR